MGFLIVDSDLSFSSCGKPPGPVAGFQNGIVVQAEDKPAGKEKPYSTLTFILHGV